MSDRSNPFRDAAEAPTALALARLRERPVTLVRRACGALARYRVSTSSSPRDHDVACAERLGLENLGNAAEGVRRVYRKRIYVDRARTTQAHLGSLGYFFITYFESGKCIITWDHQQPQTQSSAVLLSRASKGNFDDDYDAHVISVRSLAQKDVAIAVRDLRDAIALGDFYYRGVSPAGLGTLVALLLLLP